MKSDNYTERLYPLYSLTSPSPEVLNQRKLPSIGKFKYHRGENSHKELFSF